MTQLGMTQPEASIGTMSLGTTQLEAQMQSLSAHFESMRAEMDSMCAKVDNMRAKLDTACIKVDFLFHKEMDPLQWKIVEDKVVVNGLRNHREERKLQQK